MSAPTLAQLTSFDDDVSVVITQPANAQPAFGQVEFEAGLYPEDYPVERVLFYLDNVLIQELRTPPYKITVDTGQENRGHKFSVIVERLEGDDLEAVRTTSAIAIDEEISVELQQLYVTVERSGTRELGLTQADFQIYDDSQRQEIVTFEGGDVPIAASLVIDSSASMGGARLEAALTGAKTFVSGMRELDEASLLLFSHELLRHVPFTGDAAVLSRGLEAIAAKGNTAINDHLYLALKQLDDRQGRRVVVLLSDGADLHSVLGMDDVLWKARRSQAVIYWIRLQEGEQETGTFSTAWRDYEGNEHEYEMVGRTVRETGGRIVDVPNIGQIEAAFEDIMSELREQYVIGYYPSTRKGDGAWHKVRIRVAGFGHKVRTRGGYVDF